MQGDSKVRSTSADDQNFLEGDMHGELQKKSGGGCGQGNKKYR